jgi:hypothetical protein
VNSSKPSLTPLATTSPLSPQQSQPNPLSQNSESPDKEIIPPPPHEQTADHIPNSTLASAAVTLANQSEILPRESPASETASNSSIRPTSLQFQNHSVTMFTYRAQLTFGISKSKEVNVADFFLNWFQESLTTLPNFTLLPFYKESDGQPAPTPSEILPNNIKFFETYFANHRVLNHGNLMVMVQFKTSISWSNIKSFKNPYFAWLRLHRVYLNYTKFKTDRLVACVFWWELT